MTTRKENDLMTRVGRECGAGGVLRQFWQPAALSEELAGAKPVVPVTLLGEELVLFRDEQGRLGLLERQCPHRCADLSFGRRESGGLRCSFHGWLFDVNGRCLEQPGEPVGSRTHLHLRHRAYPCEERNGIIFAYLGEGAPPPLPSFDCFVAPAEQTFAFKGLWECNWLQALEVGIDPAHPSFLHRFLEQETDDPAYGKQFRSSVGAAALPLTRILREYPRPTIQLEDTAWGFRLVTTRDLENGLSHYRVTNLLFPNAIVIPMSSDMTITQWHVPIDDRSCYWYSLFTSFGAPVDRETMRAQRLASLELPLYRPRLGREGRWGFDHEDQQKRTYTGLGMDVNAQDQWAVESPGPIHDRTREHLGTTDVAIVKYRKRLLAAIRAREGGGVPPYVLDEASARAAHGPVAIDAIGSRDERDCWTARDRERREVSAWARRSQPA